MLFLVTLCGACAFLVRANTTDAQLGVLTPSTGLARDDHLLLGILRKMENLEKDRAQDKLDRAQDKLDRAQDKLDRAQDKQELLQAIGEVSDAVVTAATSDRVYACARGAAVLLHTKWDELVSKQCSAFPLFSAQPQEDSTIFLTSAHCFGDTNREGASFASTTLLYSRRMPQPLTCSLVHNFFFATLARLPRALLRRPPWTSPLCAALSPCPCPPRASLRCPRSTFSAPSSTATLTASTWTRA